MSIPTGIIEKIESEISSIPEVRKEELKSLAGIINESVKTMGKAQVNFVCTHNSRRSQLAQIMFWLALNHYNVSNISSWSSGTEATAFNYRMVKALQEFGMNILKLDEGDNPKFHIRTGNANENTLLTFSKVIDDVFNPASDFIAVMVCDHADQNCPFVPGAWKRFSLPYLDPKAFDDSPEESKAYSEKVFEIGREMFYLVQQLS
ncbi:MAG: protein-tyrosine-phosphatase [Saprospiraceae bacterium]|nr:protein-tyrosine-phosphatase [Saprospiraceae bacterium]